ncbi:KinB-signaling pathway activation protein [Cytobacillus gottheilii]|uniref:KinB-signaling pathway activation protein n=1 Tax=Cytobacillus gottheilii TaxID=859144 RepID=UPI0009BB95FA|nr:KinB-signaling pathway activation protein [Cytobacillus gottheilii]
MTSRLWVKLFLSTLLLGGVVTSITGFIVRWDEFSSIFMPFDFLEVLSVLFWLFGVGLIFSIISQMGFFAYLTIHRFGLGIFKSHKLWNGVQVVLIVFVLFDLVYFRYNAFAEEGDSLLPYIGLAGMLLAAGLIAAFLKVRISSKETFIPALFFMIVVTSIEWVPILRVNEHSWVWLMIFPLLICNAYQLLILQKINEQSRMRREQMQAKKNIPLKK